MTAETALLALIERGQALLARERKALMAADFGGIESFTAEKEALLAEIEATIASAPATDALRSGLSRLVEESRRNERLLAAALSGLRAARRRLAAIMAARNGEVAYAPDGSRITSRADAISKTQSA